MLDRHGLVKRARAAAPQGHGHAASTARAPNDLWCADFKGEFKLGNGRYCYPLTVTDHASRFSSCAKPWNPPARSPVIAAFERLFHERGLPDAIRTDNGLPFASPNGLFNLSKLSVWWLRLGIAIERIKPGQPAAERPPRAHAPHPEAGDRPAAGPQQPPAAGALRRLLEEFNAERPHEALAMRRPAEVYTPRHAPYSGLPDLDYPFHDRDILVTACGRICMHRKKINISTVLAGQRLGIKEVDDGIWLVSFMHYDLGYIDLEQRTLQPLDNPFGTRLSPMS